MLSDHSATPYTHFPEYFLLHPMLSKYSALVNVKSLTFNKDRERSRQEFYIFYIVTHLILQRGRKHTQSRLSWKSHIWPSHPPKPSSDLQPESLPTLTVSLTSLCNVRQEELQNLICDSDGLHGVHHNFSASCPTSSCP